jgi:hypothetical protein
MPTPLIAEHWTSPRHHVPRLGHSMERTKEDRERLGKPLLYEWGEIMVVALSACDWELAIL